MQNISASEIYAKWRYKLLPSHIIGEILSKDWIDNAIPALILLLTVGIFASIIPGFLYLNNLTEIIRQVGEITFVTLGVAIVIMAGGIDLTV